MWDKIFTYANLGWFIVLVSSILNLLLFMKLRSLPEQRSIRACSKKAKYLSKMAQSDVGRNLVALSTCFLKALHEKRFGIEMAIADLVEVMVKYATLQKPTDLQQIRYELIQETIQRLQDEYTLCTKQIEEVELLIDSAGSEIYASHFCAPQNSQLAEHVTVLMTEITENLAKAIPSPPISGN